MQFTTIPKSRKISLENMNPQAAQNFLSNIFSLWINPEIELRKNNKSLSTDFTLNKAQVIFTIDGQRIIRLNDEIKASIKTNLRLITDMSVNFDFTQESIEALDRIKEEEDFGHSTIVKVRDLWVLAFDFRYGIKSSKDYYQLGNEFLKAAKYSHENDNYQATISNLFIAMENFMKARIFLYPDSEIRKITKKHSAVARKVNIHFKQSKIIKNEYKEVFNFLKRLYDKGIRYIPSMSIEKNKIEDSVNKVESFSKEISNLYQQKLFFKD